MKHTFFFVCALVCAIYLVATDAQPSTIIEQSSASGESRARELTEFEQACQRLRSNDPNTRRAGFYALKLGLYTVHLVEHLASGLLYRGIMPNCLDQEDYNDIDQGRFVFVESEDTCIQLSRPCIRSHAPYIIVGRDSKPLAHELESMYVSPQNIRELHDLDDDDMRKLELLIEEKKKERAEKADRAVAVCECRQRSKASSSGTVQERPYKRARTISSPNHDGPINIISRHPQGGSVRIHVECFPE